MARLDGCRFRSRVARLGLKTTAGAKIFGDIGWVLNTGFGISRTRGPYIIADSANDLSLTFSFTIPAEFQLVGQMGLFDLLLTAPTTGGANGLSGQLDLNFAPSSGDARKLYFSDFASSLSSAQINTSQAAHLDLAATFGFGFEKDANGRYQEQSDFPSLTADLIVDWNLAALAPPTVSFGHLKLNFGELLNHFLDPIIRPIVEVLEPMKPILDFLTTPVPIVSSLGNRQITLIDLARLFGDGADAAADFVESVAEVARIASLLGRADEGISLDLGDLNFGSLDLRKARGDGAGALPTQFTGVDDAGFKSLIAGSALKTADQIRSQPGASQFSQVSPKNGKSGFSIPILDNPTSIVGMMFGLTVDLVRYKPPAVLLSLKYEFPPIPVWPTPPVTLTIGVFAQFELHLEFGYDSTGFAEFAKTRNTFDLLDGLFLDDDPDNLGGDPKEATLRIGVSAKGRARRRDCFSRRPRRHLR